MLLSPLRSSEKVSNITLLDEVKRTTEGVQAPGPHHLESYQENALKNVIPKHFPHSCQLCWETEQKRH